MNHYLFKYSIGRVADFFCKKRVTSVSTHSSSSFSIHFKNCDRLLYINLSPQNNFIFPVNISLKTDRTNDTPFFTFLRKKLPGLILKSVSQKYSERYAYLFFEDIRGHITNRFVMIIEMIDRMSNAIFADNEYTILQAYKYTDKTRVIFPHRKYEPPLSDMPDLLCENMEKLILRYKHKENILGLNGFLRKILKNEKDFENFVEIAKKAFTYKTFQLCTYGNKQVYPFCFSKNGHKTDENYLIENFILKPQKNVFENKKKNLRNIIKKRLSFVERRVKKIEKELNNAQDADRYRIIAENLMANPQTNTKYKNSITLKDVYTGNNIEIALNPNIDIFANAQAYFKKFKKAKNGRKIIEKRLADSRYELEFLEQLLFDIENAENENELDDIKNIIIEEKSPKTNKKRSRQADYTPYEHLNIMGFDAYIGKNARGNDYIVMKMANKNDLWFHPHQKPGAHLILKTQSGLQNTDDNVKMKCACEVAKRTKAEYGEKVDVDYTFAKYVKKPKGLRVGMVLYSNFKTLTVKKSESC